MANRKRPKMVSASKIYDSSEGVWRTIGGRRVFIRKGQSLSDAMKESGKFKRKGYTNEDYQKQENNIAQLKREYNALLDEEIDYQKDWDISEDPSPELEMTAWEREAKEEALREAQNKYREMEKNPYVERKYGVNKQELSNLKGKHIAGKQDKFYTRKDGTKEYDPYKGTRFEKKYDSVEDALNDPNHPTRKYIDEKLNWREQVKRNNELMEKELEDYKKSHDISRESDGYYEIFRNNERRNAKIKQEVPTEPYEYVEAYAGYHDKSYKLAGTKMSGKDVVEYGRNSWTGKEYTNDEFMEHLTDSNWHQERKMLEEAKLTNEELSYIKDHTTLSQWSVGEELTGSKNTQKMIDEAKDYSKYAKKIREKQNTPYYKQQMNKAVNDLQSSALENKYKGTVDYLKQTTNMSGAEILELLKRIDEDKK